MNYIELDSEYEEVEVLEEGFMDDEITSKNVPSNKKTYSGIQNVLKMLEGSSRFAFEADMLDLIFDRPPIFDYTLPIRSRTPSIINHLWEEIKKELELKNPTISIQIEIIKSMYKNMRNNYTRYNTNKDKVTPSGSAAKVVTEPKHLEQLRRLDGVILKRKQKSSLDSNIQEMFPTTPSPTSMDSANLDDEIMFPPRKRADFLEPLNQLVANTNKVALDPTPPVDMEQLFGNQVTLFLRELNLKEKYAAQLYFVYMNVYERNY